MMDDEREAERIYTVGGMDCAGCAREVEAGVARLDGVARVEVDFMSGQMRLSGAVPFDALKARVEALGKTLEAPPDQPLTPSPDAERGMSFWAYLLSRGETRSALLGGALVLATLVMTFAGLPEELAALLYTVGLGVAVYPIAESGLNALRFIGTFNINLLMTIAAAGAVLIGEHLEAATVIFFFAIGEALEGYTADRARQSIRALLALKPTTARRLDEADGESVVPVEALRVGDRLLVRPGERVPTDGEVLSGAGGVDQSPITGESVPVAKAPGDALFAGSINGEAALVMRATALAEDNTLSRIVRLVEAAGRDRAPTQRLVDRFAAVYTPAVVALAALAAFVPPLLFGAPFYDTPDGHGWLYRALSMLVIACPCALVISTPVTVISGIAAAARRGVLVKGGAYLEALADARVVAFDKTGTLTRGQPAVLNWRAADCATGDPCAECDDVLALATAVERRASHPLAGAVVAAAQARALDAVYAPAESVETLAGQGVRGQVGGAAVTVGSHRYFDAHFPHAAAFCAQVADAESGGQTAVLIAEDDRVRGYIALADEPRPESAMVVAELRALGLTTVMLTGDHPAAASRVAEAVGVDAARAGLLPGDKVAAVRELAAAHPGGVVMVGDGINDTPALAAATVGVAMGGAGSPQALETADVALLADDLTQLPFAVRLARFVRRLIAQNIAISFGVKLLFLILALFGFTSLWLAILADVGMALLVALNGMRPLRMARAGRRG